MADEDSSVGLDHSGFQKPIAKTTPEEKNIRLWLTHLFLHVIKAGERLLEDGQLTAAAAMFANATLLIDDAELFVASVRRVYPSSLYRLYEQRMLTMGYGHLFPNTKNAVPSKIRHRYSAKWSTASAINNLKYLLNFTAFPPDKHHYNDRLYSDIRGNVFKNKSRFYNRNQITLFSAKLI